MNTNNKIILGIAVVIALAVAGVFIFSNSSLGLNLFGKNGPASTAFDQSLSGNPQNESSTSSNLSVPQNLPAGIKSNNLTAVNGKEGTATFVTVNDGKNFALVIEAKLPDPGVGQNYYAWLGTSLSDKNLVPMGKLQKNGDKFMLSFNQTGDYSKYKAVIVTLESNDDNIPETHVLEGTI